MRIKDTLSLPPLFSFSELDESPDPSALLILVYTWIDRLRVNCIGPLRLHSAFMLIYWIGEAIPVCMRRNQGLISLHQYFNIKREY